MIYYKTARSRNEEPAEYKKSIHSQEQSVGYKCSSYSLTFPRILFTKVYFLPKSSLFNRNSVISNEFHNELTWYFYQILFGMRCNTSGWVTKLKIKGLSLTIFPKLANIK